MTARVLINHVKRAVCAVYGVTNADLDRRDRRARLVAPRQMAMAVAKALTGQSWAQIGRVFGRDEKPVRHAAAAVQRLMEASPTEAETYFEVVRLAQRYAVGDYAATPRFSRSADLDVVPDAEIRAMRDLPPYAIAQRVGVPVSEVARVLEGAGWRDMTSGPDGARQRCSSAPSGR